MNMESNLIVATNTIGLLPNNEANIHNFKSPDLKKW